MGAKSSAFNDPKLARCVLKLLPQVDFLHPNHLSPQRELRGIFSGFICTQAAFQRKNAL
jgi:hypothetical protein